MLYECIDRGIRLLKLQLFTGGGVAVTIPCFFAQVGEMR